MARPTPVDYRRPRHAHAGLGVGAGRHWRGARRAVDRLRQPGAQPGQPAAVPGLPPVSSGAIPPGRRSAARWRPGPRRARAQQLVGLPAAGGLRCARDGPGGARRCARPASLWWPRAGNEGPRCSSVASPIAISTRPSAWARWTKAANWRRFSSRGPVTVDGSSRIKPDIVAPGVDVLSSLPGSTYGSNQRHLHGRPARRRRGGADVVGQPGAHRRHRPHRAGPRRQRPAVRQPVLHHRRPCDQGPLPNNGVGYGLLDAYAAVEMAVGIAPEPATFA